MHRRISTQTEAWTMVRKLSKETLHLRPVAVRLSGAATEPGGSAGVTIC